MDPSLELVDLCLIWSVYREQESRKERGRVLKVCGGIVEHIWYKKNLGRGILGIKGLSRHGSEEGRINKNLGCMKTTLLKPTHYFVSLGGGVLKEKGQHDSSPG